MMVFDDESHEMLPAEKGSEGMRMNDPLLVLLMVSCSWLQVDR